MFPVNDQAAFDEINLAFSNVSFPLVKAVINALFANGNGQF